MMTPPALVLTLTLLAGGALCPGPGPRILSALYGYDGCIGGVRGLLSEQDYLEDLARRGCTVEAGETNVASVGSLVLACRDWRFWSLSWRDGIPLVFNSPLQARPAPDSVQLQLSDGALVHPVCVMLGPANEDNELDTLLLLGHFGDGLNDTLRPVSISIVEDVTLVGPEGPTNARGLSYSSQEDFNYLTSTVRLTSAKLWDATTNPEDFRPPTWPLPSSTYPNHCGSLYPATSHVLRATFSGGVTTDGITSIRPTNKNIFRLSSDLQTSLTYLGLADLGQTTGEELAAGEKYRQDGDNYLDICLDLSGQQDDLAGDITLEVLCDPALENSVLYPPKGKPHGCSPQKVTLSAENYNQNIIMSWTAP